MPRLLAEVIHHNSIQPKGLLQFAPTVQLVCQTNFPHCYPVFQALLLNPCFIIVCYFLLAMPTVH